VTSRGNEKKDIFWNDDDRRLFLRIFTLVLQRRNWICHAYVLMGNHYHLLIETPDANISQGMRQLNSIYAEKFNEIHQRVGHLFQGRFHGILIENEAYLLTVARYIVLNPVRAGMATYPKEYVWSSYRETAGYISQKPFLDSSRILGLFSQAKSDAQQKYRMFVEERAGKESPFSSIKNGILGTEQFIVETSLHPRGLPESLEFPHNQKIIGRPLLDDCFHNVHTKTERNWAIFIAIFACGYSAVEVARHLSLHYSWVSRIFHRECAKSKKQDPTPL